MLNKAFNFNGEDQSKAGSEKKNDLVQKTYQEI